MRFFQIIFAMFMALCLVGSSMQEAGNSTHLQSGSNATMSHIKRTLRTRKPTQATTITTKKFTTKAGKIKTD